MLFLSAGNCRDRILLASRIPLDQPNVFGSIRLARDWFGESANRDACAVARTGHVVIELSKTRRMHVHSGKRLAVVKLLVF